MQLSSIQFTQDQISKLMAYANSPGPDHIAGIPCLLTTKLDDDVWIFDSGVTDHITPYEHVLRDIASLKKPFNIVMGTGEKELVTHVGNHVLSDKVMLRGVPLVPKIHFNLISLAKFVVHSGLVVKFTDKQ